MALTWQILDVTLTGGVDTKTNIRLVEPPEVTTLQNAILGDGTPSKRNGYQALSNRIIGSTSSALLPRLTALSTFNSELLGFGSGNVYSYSSGSQGWISKGPAISVTLGNSNVVRNNFVQTIPDMAEISGTSLFAWEDSRGGVRGTLYDETSGTPILSDISITTTGAQPQCVAFAGLLYVFYTDGNAIKARSISPANPTSFVSESTISTGYSSPGQYAVINGGQNMILAFNAGSGQSTVAYVNTTLTLIQQATLTDGIIGGASIVQTPDYQNLVFVATAGVTGSVNLFILNPANLSIISGALPVDTTAAISGTIRNLTGLNLYNASSPGGVQYYYEVLPTSSQHQNAYIKTTNVNFSGSAGSNNIFFRSVGLAGKVFTTAAPLTSFTQWYLPVAHDSALQATYFLARNDGNIAAKYQGGQGGGLTAKPGMLASVVNTMNPDKFKTALLTKGSLQSVGGNVFTTTGVTRELFDFSNASSYRTAQIGTNLIINGGIISNYDGVSVTEHGFHLYPEFLTGTIQTGSGLQSGSTYSWVATYEWQDNTGLVHQSVPSPALTVTTFATASSQMLLNVDTLRLTSKTTPRANVSVVFWRTQPNGNVYFRVSNPTGSTQNSLSVDSASFTDTVPDTVLVGNAELYTNGGVLPYYSPPAATLLTVWDGRIWLGGMEDPLALWYSNAFVPGLPVTFNPGFTIEMDATGGPVTALRILDDSLVIYKANRYYLLSGFGPNSIGQNNQFDGPTWITSETGCTNPNSVVDAPAATYFFSPTGIRRLSSRGLLIDYIGAPVENVINDQTITAATLIQNATQIRFLCSDGDAAVYDYFYNRWTTFANHTGFDAVIWNGLYVYASTTGQILVETPGQYLDVNRQIPMVIETGWYNFGKLQGLEKVSDMAIGGTYFAPHKLKIDIAYDNGAYVNTIYAPVSALNDNTYGTDNPYGVPGINYGGNAPSYQFRIGLPRWQFSTIRFRFTDVATSITPGSKQGYGLQVLSFRVGSYGRLRTIPAAQAV